MSVFPGCIIDADDPRYPTMVQGFNPRWIGKPKYVQVCGDTKQVVAAVKNAYEEGMRITARGGGHCYENFVCENVGGVIIDLSPMNGVYLDPATNLYCVEGGATLWNVYNELYREYGLTLPGGSCYSVGVGGHVTGGGYGLLSRLHGLTIDYLEAIELVRVNAKGVAEAIVVARDSPNIEHREIMWAHLGGGGGNFGIVTKFWFAEPPPAPEWACIVNLAWDWEELNESSFESLIVEYGKEMVEISKPGQFPGMFSLLHLTQNSGPGSQIVVTVQLVGRKTAPLEEFVGGIGRSLPKPRVQRSPVGYHNVVGQTAEVQVVPWLFATQALNGAKPNQRGKYKSAYMTKGFPTEQIETMWKYLYEQPNEVARQALLQVDSYGGQINTVAPDATAIPQRSSAMKLQYQTYWSEPSGDAQNLEWIRQFYGEMYEKTGGEPMPVPTGVTDGCYVNYPDVDLVNWQQLYYKGNYPRLQKAKALADPKGVFWHQQSIKPSKLESDQA